MDTGDKKLVPSAKNKDVIQSYKLTTARNNIGLYGQRLLLRLVEFANSTGAIEGQNFTNVEESRPIQMMEELFGEFRNLTMPATAILGTKEEYTKLHKDLVACMHHIIEYKDEDGALVAFPLLSYAKSGKRGITVSVREELWQAMLDFSEGFRKFELKSALAFKSTYSLRLYLLMSGQTNPLTYSISQLKDMFGLIEKNPDGSVKKEKYKRAPDFIDNVIEPAKRELDACSPYTFEYELLTSRRCIQGRAAITAIRFTPLKQDKFRDADLVLKEQMNKYSGAFGNFGLSIAEANILKHKFGITQKGIKNNFALWTALKKNNIDILSELDHLAVRVANLRPQNPAGYVINSLKGILKEAGIKI